MRAVKDLEKIFRPVAAEEAPCSKQLQREATVQGFVPSVQFHLIAMSSEWFLSYINDEMVQNHECCTAERDFGGRAMKLLRTNTVASAGASDHGCESDVAFVEH